MAKSKIIPLNKIKKLDIICVKGGITASSIMTKYKPDVLINLALYDTDTKTNMTFIEDENVKSGSYFSEDGIGILGDNKPIWCSRHDAYKDNNIRDYVSGSPVLVRNNKPVKDFGNKYSSYVDGKHIRSCIGFNKDNLILVVSDGDNTLEGMRDYCIRNYNPQYLINLDGGGSCHLQEKNKVYASSVRANCSWLLVYLKEDPKPRTITVTDTTINFEGQTLNGFITNGTTHCPVRQLSEMLGLKVEFINGQVYIKR